MMMCFNDFFPKLNHELTFQQFIYSSLDPDKTDSQVLYSDFSYIF